MMNWKICILLMLFSSQAKTLSLEANQYLASLAGLPPHERAEKLVQKLNEESWLVKDRHWLKGNAALFAQEAGNYDLAINYWKEIASTSDLLGLLALVELSKIYASENQLDRLSLVVEQAKKHKEFKNYRSLQYQIAITEWKISIDKKDLKQSNKIFALLKSRYRDYFSKQQQAEFELILAEKFNNSSRRCQAATQLFISYPLSEAVKHYVGVIPYACPLSIEQKRQRLKTLFFLGHQEKAEQDIKFLKENGSLDNDSIQMMYADLALKEGDLTRSLLTLESLINKGSTVNGLLNLYATALSRAQRFEEASFIYRQLMLQSKTDPGSHFYDHAFVLYQGGLYDKASLAFADFIKDYPRHKKFLEAQWHLGWIYYLNKDYHMAKPLFESLALNKKYSENTKVVYWLARTYWYLHLDYQALDLLNIVRHQKYRIYNYYANLSETLYNENRLALSWRIPMDSFLKQSILLPHDTESNLMRSRPEDQLLPKIIAAMGVAPMYSPVDVQDSMSAEEVVLEQQIIQETDFFADQFASRLKNIEGLKSLGLLDLVKSELLNLYREVKLLDQKILVLSQFDQLENFHQSARLAELQLLGRTTIDRKSWMLKAFPLAYQSTVKTNAKRFNVYPTFIYSIMRAESLFNPNIESPVHAKGLMQLMPFTAEKVAQSLSLPTSDLNLFAPEVNIQLGTAYLARLLNQFDNNVPLAAAAYNAGPHRVQNWLSQFGHFDHDIFIEHIPFKETRGYVKKVIGFMEHYRRYLGTEFKGENINASLIGPMEVSSKARRPAAKEIWDN